MPPSHVPPPRAPKVMGMGRGDAWGRTPPNHPDAPAPFCPSDEPERLHFLTHGLLYPLVEFFACCWQPDEADTAFPAHRPPDGPFPVHLGLGGGHEGPSVGGREDGADPTLAVASHPSQGTGPCSLPGCWGTFPCGGRRP